MKHLIGKQVWLRPTGNAARRNGNIVCGVIKSVAKVYVVVTKNGFDEKLRMNPTQSNFLNDSSYNSGYEVYESKESADQQIEKERLAYLISDKLRYSRDIECLDFSLIEQIALALGLIK